MAIQQGWNQQTATIQHLIRSATGALRSGGGRRRRGNRKGKKNRVAVRVSVGGGRRRRARRGRARLVKGSAAAKRYMASIRRKRKK